MACEWRAVPQATSCRLALLRWWSSPPFAIPSLPSTPEAPAADRYIFAYRVGGHARSVTRASSQTQHALPNVLKLLSAIHLELRVPKASRNGLVRKDFGVCGEGQLKYSTVSDDTNGRLRPAKCRRRGMRRSRVLTQERPRLVRRIVAPRQNASTCGKQDPAVV
eukprot:scaffold203360_cov36-Tisochrysis_lutea.AAC.1